MPSREVVEKTKKRTSRKEPKRKVQAPRASSPKGILKKQGAQRTSRSGSIRWRLKQNKTKYFDKDETCENV